MALTARTVCDHPASTQDHPADIAVALNFLHERWTMDVCAEHAPDLRRALQAAGLRPTTAQVGHNLRQAHTAASGRVFTTKEARIWLKAQGIHVSEVGRLTAEQLARYADAH